MVETLVSDCHRSVLRAYAIHPSRDGYELLIHPMLREQVEMYEEEMMLLPGSFATLTGARRAVYTAAAGGTYAVFCLTHMHRLDWASGAADAGGAPGAGTISS